MKRMRKIMIEFINICKDKPYKLFEKHYEEALNKKQKIIEGISISSFDKSTQKVTSRFVNLKYIRNEDWIFFSNYNSPKSNSFLSHCQISALIHWPETSFQLRILANIKKTSDEFSNDHFSGRSIHKNAVAISSNQSKKISSYDDVIKNYENALAKGADFLSKRPDYWGGFSFKPYYFEFWTGNNSRINKRIEFVKKDDVWEESFLHP